MRRALAVVAVAVCAVPLVLLSGKVCAVDASLAGGAAVPIEAALPGPQRPIAELKPAVVLHVGKTADWVAVTPNAVWVASTGPFAVHRIDPATNKVVATVALPGEPCAGLVAAFGNLWVPICGKPSVLAKVGLQSNSLTSVFKVGPAAQEGGITASSDSIWLVVNKSGSLARIDPDKGTVRQTVQIPPGSYNPIYSDGQVWVTRAEGAEITRVDATTGAIVATVKTGPQPRFLSAGAGSIWTLNQGDGSLTRIDARNNAVIATIALGTPGHGGDVGFGDGTIWTTMPKVPLSAVSGATSKVLCQWVGPGGDSLGVGHDAIWLTDYHGGTISRLGLKDALARCVGASSL